MAKDSRITPMRSFKRLLAVTGLAVGFIGSSFAQANTVLKVYTEDYAPYNFKDSKGQADGFSTEVLKEVVKRTPSVSIENDTIVVWPWSRAMKKLDSEANTVLFTMTRNEKRENLYKWVGPIASRTMYMWKTKGNANVNVKNFADLGKYRFSALRDSAAAKSLAEHVTDKRRLLLSKDETANIKKFINGRVDMIMYTQLGMAYALQKNGFSFNQVEEAFLFNDKYQYYLGINKQTDDKVVHALQGSLDAMKKDGTFDAIKAKYLK